MGKMGKGEEKEWQDRALAGWDYGVTIWKAG